ncbi:MAG: tail fiber domain-containing protein [Bacteroidia bacterium]
MKNILKIKIVLLSLLAPLFLKAQKFTPGNPGTRTSFVSTANGELCIKKDSTCKILVSTAGGLKLGSGQTGGSDTTALKINSDFSGALDALGLSARAVPALGYGIGVQGSGGRIGVQGSVATLSSTALIYGGYFTSSGTGSGAHYGVYASASGSTSNNYPFYSQGTSVSTGGWITTSDERLKQNIKPLNNALDKIMQLKPSSYNFKTDEYVFMNLPKEKQYGFIAQDLEKVFPEMVSEIQQPYINKDGSARRDYFTIKGISYEQLIAVLVSAIQEDHKNNEKTNLDVRKELDEKNELIAKQNEQINILKTRLDQFENDLMKCCNNLRPNSAQGIMSDNKKDAPSLEQNAPNPFSENTVIKYYLPSSVKSASINVTSLNGSIVNSYPIEERGANQLMISGKKLKAGSYLYSLEADGKTIESKLMILTK